MKYRKKPVVIEAIQFTKESYAECATFIGSAFNSLGDDLTHIDILTLEGEMTASLGDFIIQGVNGEFYPCKPDIFAKTYEKVDP